MHTGLVSLAVRDLLRDSFLNYVRFPLKANQIEVMPDIRPAPFQGNYFISVYGNDWSSVEDDTNVGLDYQLGVSCSLTFRSPTYPMKTQGIELYAKQFAGMSSVCLKIAKTVSQNTSIAARMSAFEEYLDYQDSSDSTYVGQMFEYLRFQGCDPNPIPVYSDHFSAKNEHLSDEAGEAIMGYVMTVRFNRARCGIRL